MWDGAARAGYLEQLLDLVTVDSMDALLRRALALAIAVTDATIGYVELYGADQAPEHWHAAGCTEGDLSTIRASISRGIIGRAVSRGQTIRTPSAFEDRHFKDLGSVKASEMRAVLCAPIGMVETIGALFLRRPTPFTPEHEEAIDRLVRQLGCVCLLRRAADPVRPETIDEATARMVLDADRRNDGNVSRTARELDMSPGWVRKVLRAHRDR